LWRSSIILAAAVTLHANGTTDVATSEQAARALKPLAGKFAFIVFFARGSLGRGLLAVPGAGGIGGVRRGRGAALATGSDRKPLDAKGFLRVLATATLLGWRLIFRPGAALHAFDADQGTVLVGGE